MRKTTWLFVILVLTVIVVILMPHRCSTCGKYHVIHDYFQCVGLSHRFPTAEDIQEDLGEPLEIIEVHRTVGDKEIKEIEYCYDGLQFFFSFYNGAEYNTGNLRRMEVTSPNLGFSKYVHVGSSRAQIKWAYRGITRADYKEPLGSSYFDYFAISTLNHMGQTGFRYVEFEYDEDNRVSKITYAPIW